MTEPNPNEKALMLPLPLKINVGGWHDPQESIQFYCPFVGAPGPSNSTLNVGGKGVDDEKNYVKNVRLDAGPVG